MLGRGGAAVNDQEWEELANEFPDSLIAHEWRFHVAWQGFRREMIAALGGERLYRFLLWLAKAVRHD